MNLNNDKALFPMGSLYITAGVHTWSEYTIDNAFLLAELLARHATGDWGDIAEGDKGINEQAIKDGSRIMSVYKLEDTTLWIITEADRSTTTVLLPSEY